MSSPPVIPVLNFPAELPVAQRAEEIIAALRAHPTLILAGETGSGKTTQLPKLLLAAGFGTKGRIACTQPRRVAALSVSRRVAEELQVPWGSFVGCQIRFQDQSNPETVVKFMTDGILLNEVQRDPLLRGYEAIILDEAHERSLNLDFLLGHFAQIRHKRPDLRLVITSATLDTEAFAKAFPGAPVLQVQGRTYPVTVEWRPLDHQREEKGDVSHTEAAADLCREIALEHPPGDILVFMPTEADIRETCALLEKNGPHPSEVLPLFGRLSAADQQRIFKTSTVRKIVVSTNVAETSLTIPGIRYVVDSGLVRLSRYSPQTRTLRLPVEEISQSSANQRKGRCGRVAEGVCYRLYSQAEYDARPRHTPPEILRSNLASVILRLAAFNLGDIETFPFIDPPAERAVKAGMVQLRELGAIDQQHRLTSLGRRLARLPVDPTIARMLLQAMDEDCLPEVLIIASGLSIQDPRERPHDKPEEADRLHQPYLNPDSDFLSLLNIWNAFHDKMEKLSTSNLRRFCIANYLNFLRLREWRDLHGQLAQAVRDLGPRKNPKHQAPSGKENQLEVSSASGLKSEISHLKSSGASENRDSRIENQESSVLLPLQDRLHRAIISGLLGNVARYEEQHHHYLATHNRKAYLFPGSALAKAAAARAKARAKELKAAGKRPKGPPAPVKLPPWIACAAWMETSRLYARTAARIRPEWIMEFGAHLLQTSLTEPFWDPETCRALIKERTRLYGLEIRVRAVSHLLTDPVGATETFVREGLVADTLTEHFDFLAHNREIRTRVEERLTRLRAFSSTAVEEALYRFYADRIRDVASPPDLHRFLRETRQREPKLLWLRESDLCELPDESSANGLPARVNVGGEFFPVVYRHAPGEENDGATLHLPVHYFPLLPPGFLDWLVPGYLADRVEALLRALPKQHRVALQPLSENARNLTAALAPCAESLTEVLTRLIRERHGAPVVPGDWDASAVDAHLRPRLVLLTPDDKELASSRDLESLRPVWEKERSRQTAAAFGTMGEAGRNIPAKPAKKAQSQPQSTSPTRPSTIINHKSQIINPPAASPGALGALRVQHERPGLFAWTFPDLPEKFPAGEAAGVPLFAWPALKVEARGDNSRDLALRLFPQRAEAEAATIEGLLHLAENELARELRGLDHSLAQDLKALALVIQPLGTLEEFLKHTRRHARLHLLGLDSPPPAAEMTKSELQNPKTTSRPNPAPVSKNQESGIKNLKSFTALSTLNLPTGPASLNQESRIKNHKSPVSPLAAALPELHPALALPLSTVGLPILPLTAANWSARVSHARRVLPGFSERLTARFKFLLETRAEVSRAFPDDKLLSTLILAPGFPGHVPHAALPHLERWLKARKQRLERRRFDPAKDTERAAKLQPWRDRAGKLLARPTPSAQRQAVREALLQVEEYAVSLFAPDQPTAVKVSEKTLAAAFEAAGG